MSSFTFCSTCNRTLPLQPQQEAWEPVVEFACPVCGDAPRVSLPHFKQLLHEAADKRAHIAGDIDNVSMPISAWLEGVQSVFAQWAEGERALQAERALTPTP